VKKSIRTVLFLFVIAMLPGWLQSFNSVVIGNYYHLRLISLASANDSCGAFVAPGVWKEFDCYNLAAIGKTTNDDPFTPSWRLIGGYWQWGRKGPDSSRWYDTNTSNFAHGPTGPGSNEANSSSISGWDSSYATDGAWSNSSKTINDPCPAGFRVPTIAQWEGVIENNNQSTVGTWDADETNYSSARFFGNDFMLPATGFRINNSGKLGHRGYYGGYWSSSESSSSNSWYMHFGSGFANVWEEHGRWRGFSIRCIADTSSSPPPTIQVDGSADDWVGIPAYAQDPMGDLVCNAGPDLKAVYFAKDSQYLYWRIDSYSGEFGSDYHPSIHFYQKADGKSDYDVHARAWGHQDSGVVWQYTDQDGYVKIHAGVEFGKIDSVAEGKIPLSLFSGNQIIKIYAYFYNSVCSPDFLHVPFSLESVPGPGQTDIPFFGYFKGIDLNYETHYANSNDTGTNKLFTWVVMDERNVGGALNELNVEVNGSVTSPDKYWEYNGGYWWTVTESPLSTLGKQFIWTCGNQEITASAPDDMGGKTPPVSNIRITGGTDSNPVIEWDRYENTNPALRNGRYEVTIYAVQGENQSEQKRIFKPLDQPLIDLSQIEDFEFLSKQTYKLRFAIRQYIDFDNITAPDGVWMNIVNRSVIYWDYVPGDPPKSCGAFVAPGVWKEFDCYNLAAIGKTTNDDPFTPSWRLIGGYWQWGRKGPDSSRWYDTNTSNFAHGPTGPGSNEANSSSISGWSNSNNAPNGAWSDSYKTSNDPCPSGFRVPTKAQWDGVIENNNQRTVGTWDSNDTNYSSVLFFGNDLMLPAAGLRNNGIGGALYYRGAHGGYWSSSEYGSYRAWRLNLYSTIAATYDCSRRDGRSVRCISESDDPSQKLPIQVSASETATFGLKADGTVISTRSGPDVSSWTDIQQIAGGATVIGLKKNGTVVAAGVNYHNQCDVSSWSDIKQVDTETYRTLGLKSDGTLIFTQSAVPGFNSNDVSSWTGIVQIASGYGHTAGLKSDGTVMAPQDVSSWNNIVQIAAGAGHTAGLKKDGTVVAVGNNTDAQGNPSGQCDVSSWTEIIAISAGYYHTVGLKKDGTVVATGSNHEWQGNYIGQSNVSAWTDIIQIYAGPFHTVGIKSDGSIVAIGANENGQCDVSSWNLLNIEILSTLFVSPDYRNVSSDSGTTTFSVANTRDGIMNWTATVTDGGDWLSIGSGNSGSNTGTVSCQYSNNTEAISRTGTIRIWATGAANSPIDVTVTQAPPPVVTSPNSISVPSTSSTSYTVSWSSSSTSGVSYILEEATNTSFTSNRRTAYSGMGTSASITGRNIGTTYYYRVKATKSDSTESNWRTGNNGCLIIQPPVLSLNPSIRNVSSDSGTTTFSVSNTGGGTMNWSAAVISGGNWLSISSGNSGSNTGAISCQYSQNTGAISRTGKIRISATGAANSPIDVTVTQVAPCTYFISPTSDNFSSDGGTETVSVTTSRSDCAWSTSENLGWVTLSPTSGTGNGSVNVSVTTNTGAARSGSVTIAGQTYTITQANYSDISCGAYVAPGVWKEFDCYNLAAIGKTTKDDPFTPSWRLIGGYWQWGRKGPDPSQWYDTNTPHFAHGPTGPSSSEANSGAISGWDSTYAPNDVWSDSYKTSNDPCPEGFRVPTKTQWDGVRNNNAQKRTFGVWEGWPGNPTNYNNARFFGDNLMLMASGSRDGVTGALYNRGSGGYFWSSTEGLVSDSKSGAWYLGINILASGTNDAYYGDGRKIGLSVRCIKDDPPPPCTYGLSAISPNFSSDGGTETVSVTTSRSDCNWTTSENLDWLTLSPISGTGSGSLTVSVSANTGAARNGSITIAGQTYTITQAHNSDISCGAYVAPGVWKEFDCYNLAAIGKTTDDDPFTPSWRLIGGYWQWGRKGPDPSKWYDSNTEHFAHGPTGPGSSQTNEGTISEWDGNFAPRGSWSDNYKTANDPCPDGFRLPTIYEWRDVINNNTQSAKGSWSSSATNYGSASFFGEKLMLPAAGYRYYSTGALDDRGINGGYWSSSLSSYSWAWRLLFNSSEARMRNDRPVYGFSLRCMVVTETPPSKIELVDLPDTIPGKDTVFNWKHDAKATWYKIFIQDKSNKNNKFSQWYEIEDNSNKYPETACSDGHCSIVWNEDLDNGTYTWWVMGWNEYGNGQWSDGMDFMVKKEIYTPAKIVLNGPAGQLGINDDTFSWKSDPSAAWYRLFIQNSTKSYKFAQWYEIEDNSNKFPEADCIGGDCSVTLDERFTEGNYTWWVLGWNDYGNGEWSDGKVFTVSGTVFLTDDAPNYTVKAGSDVWIYGSDASNEVTIQSGAKAELISFPGFNTVQIKSNSLLFKVSRTDNVVTFQGTDGTLLKIPATAAIQTIKFNEIQALTLSIYNNRVMLDDQVITTTAEVIDGGPFALNRACLGTLSGPSVSAFRLTDLKTPIEGPVLSSNSSSDLNRAGRFSMELPNVENDEWILLKAVDGIDIDPNDDGKIVEDNFVVNHGTIFSLFRASDIREGKAVINPLGDFLWWMIKNNVLSNGTINFALVETLLDKYASVLVTDVNQDGIINFKDVISFIPREHRGHFKYGWENFVNTYVTLIRQNTHSIYVDQIRTFLSQAYFMESSEIHIAENEIRVSKVEKDSIGNVTGANQIFHSELGTISTAIVKKPDNSLYSQTHIAVQGNIISFDYIPADQTILNSVDSSSDVKELNLVFTLTPKGNDIFHVEIPKHLVGLWSTGNVTVTINDTHYHPKVILDDPVVEIDLKKVRFGDFLTAYNVKSNTYGPQAIKVKHDFWNEYYTINDYKYQIYYHVNYNIFDKNDRKLRFRAGLCEVDFGRDDCAATLENEFTILNAGKHVKGVVYIVGKQKWIAIDHDTKEIIGGNVSSENEVDFFEWKDVDVTRFNDFGVGNLEMAPHMTVNDISIDKEHGPYDFTKELKRRWFQYKKIKQIGPYVNFLTPLKGRTFQAGTPFQVELENRFWGDGGTLVEIVGKLCEGCQYANFPDKNTYRVPRDETGYQSFSTRTVTFPDTTDSEYCRLASMNASKLYEDYVGFSEPFAVHPPRVKALVISGPSSVQENSSASYTATATWEDGTTSIVTDQAVFSVKSQHATMSGAVLKTQYVNKNESVTINATYTFNGVEKTDTLVVWIKDKTLSGLNISGSSSVPENTSTFFKAIATWSDGTSNDVTGSAGFSVNSNYATMSGAKLSAKEVTSDQVVTLQASYSAGNITKNASKQITITDTGYPGITLSSINTSATSVDVGDPITFQVYVTGGNGQYSYSWDFGDNGTSNLARPSHAYDSADNYTVTLTVADTVGNKKTASVNVTVIKDQTSNYAKIVQITPNLSTKLEPGEIQEFSAQIEYRATYREQPMQLSLSAQFSSNSYHPIDDIEIIPGSSGTVTLSGSTWATEYEGVVRIWARLSYYKTDVIRSTIASDIKEYGVSGGATPKIIRAEWSFNPCGPDCWYFGTKPICELSDPDGASDIESVSVTVKSPFPGAPNFVRNLSLVNGVYEGSKINFGDSGTYETIFKVVDKRGNETSKVVTLTVVD
jgi:uncharacterized protein (TIGR02145 family)